MNLYDQIVGLTLLHYNPSIERLIAARQFTRSGAAGATEETATPKQKTP